MLRKKSLLIVTMMIMILAIPASALAGSTTVGGYTFTWPDSYESCTPSDNVSVSGVPAGWWVRFTFGNNGTIFGFVEAQSTDPSIPVSVPFPYDGRTGLFSVTMVVSEFQGIQEPSTRATGKWTVTCVPAEGCSPGYFRNHFDAWPPTGYTPSDDFDTTFGVDYFNPNITLGQAIWLGGGGVNALARLGTAALLSAAHPDVDFSLTVAEVIAIVQAGNQSAIPDFGELYCPLN